MRYYTSSRLLRGGGTRGPADGQAGRAATGGPTASAAPSAPESDAGLATRAAPGRGWRLPAGALEAAVGEAIASHLDGTAQACTLLATPDLAGIGAVTARAQALVAGLRRLDGAGAAVGPDPSGRDALLRALLREVRLGGGTLRLDLDPAVVACELGVAEADLAPALLSLAVPFAFRRRGMELKLVAGNTVPSLRPDATLVAALARAHRWVRAVREGRSLTDIARTERTSESYVRTRAALAFLSPRLQAAILEGSQPPDLTLERLVRTSLPLGWSEQERALGVGC